jgi:hypothetical protein
MPLYMECKMGKIVCLMMWADARGILKAETLKGLQAFLKGLSKRFGSEPATTGSKTEGVPASRLPLVPGLATQVIAAVWSRLPGSSLIGTRLWCPEEGPDVASGEKSIGSTANSLSEVCLRPRSPIEMLRQDVCQSSTGFLGKRQPCKVLTISVMFGQALRQTCLQRRAEMYLIWQPR